MTIVVKKVSRRHQNENVFETELKKLKILLQQNPMDKPAVDKCIEQAFESNLYSGSRTVPAYFRPKFYHYFMAPMQCIQCNLMFYVAKICVTSVFLFGLVCLLATTHSVTQKFIMRNSQNYIYPIMRSIRLWTLPIIRKYETLTDWHEEECLIKNPFYHEPLLDCWPCEDVRTMVDLTGLYNYSKAYVNNETPFLVRDVMKRELTLEELAIMYMEYKIELESGTAKFSSTRAAPQNLSNLMTKAQSFRLEKEFHILWKINRVAAARVLRKTFQRPYFVPYSSEVALQRFLCISGSEAPQFSLPVTDFANVWIAQSQGYRLIVLDPSQPCKQKCSTLSVLLRPQDVLYYNWQFWKPRSLPARLSEDISITYIGSFY